MVREAPAAVQPAPAIKARLAWSCKAKALLQAVWLRVLQHSVLLQQARQICTASDRWPDTWVHISLALLLPSFHEC